MAGDLPKARLVICPKCRGLLTEIEDIPVYRCGGCGTILRTKSRHASNMAIGHGGDHMAVPCENPPCSNNEKYSHHAEESNCSGEEGSSACMEIAVLETGLTSEYPNSAGRPAVTMEDTTSVTTVAPQPQPDGSWKPIRHGPVYSRELTESAVSEEAAFDGNPSSGQLLNLGNVMARRSHACDDSVSCGSGDGISGKHDRYRLLSRRTFKSRKISDPRTVGKMQIATPNEVCDTGNIGILSLKQRLPSIDASNTSDPEASLDSVNLYSEQNEEGSDHLSSLSSSPFRDSASLEDFPCSTSDGVLSARLGSLQGSREESPRRVDLLRNQSTRSYPGGRRGDRRVSVNRAGHDGHRPLFSGEQVATPFANANTPSGRCGASGRESTAERYPPSRLAFSEHGYGSGFYYRHAEAFDNPVQRSGIHCTSYGSHAHFHHPAPASSSCSEDGDSGHYRNSETTGHELRKLPSKEKRQHRMRRHCRPISGGAPFVVCSSCFELLQLPVDFLVSGGGQHKLRCGACTEVITFLFRGGHIVPYNAAQFDSSAEEVNNGSHELHAKHSQGIPQEDTMSYYVESGSPPSQSYSADSKAASSIQRSSPEHEGKGRYRQPMGPALHHLMGISDDADFDECNGGTEAGSAVGHNSLNVSEIEEEKEPVARLASAGGGSPLHGFKKEDAEDLKHGFENMKLKQREDGRRGTWQMKDGEWRFITDENQ